MDKKEILLTLAKNILEANEALSKAHQGWWGEKGSQAPGFWGNDDTRHSDKCDRPKGHGGKCAVRHIGGEATAAKAKAAKKAELPPYSKDPKKPVRKYPGEAPGDPTGQHKPDPKCKACGGTGGTESESDCPCMWD